MKINKCRSCESSDLISILSLGNQYLSDFTKTNKKPKSFSLELMLCRNCKLIQLSNTVPSKYLYTERYGYKSGINQTMKDELEGIVKESLKVIKKKKNLTVVDIGANDGTLLSFYPKNIFRISVEPIKKFADESKKHANIVVNSFFNFKTFYSKAGERKADIVTIISCFYDMENPNKFLKDIKSILKENGIIVIQQNYLVEMLKQNAFDNIVHEHLEYYSLLSLSDLLKRHGMEVFKVEKRVLNGGSFRTYIALKGEKKIDKSVKNMISYENKLKLKNKKIYLEFAKKIKNNKQKVFNFIMKQVAQNKSVYLYGASTRGNTLLQYYGLDKNLIKYAVERNPEKWGKKISSVGIEIISEEKARKNKPEFMLVLPWFFKEEFLKREKQYLKNGGHFIFPLPKLEVI